MKKNIILGVTGSIAAYKAADIANTLTKEGHSVHVIMTKGRSVAGGSGKCRFYRKSCCRDSR